MRKRTGSDGNGPVLFLLAGAAALSWGAASALPHEGFHPLALLAALLPLQLAALLFVFRRPG
ncbi:MAG: hypothetical protein KFB97_01765 [Cyanobium sp. M30B3]|nr:MAG: hypothetical protein KFB97_01765 [Cyanobium sp. M30B3]